MFKPIFAKCISLIISFLFCSDKLFKKKCFENASFIIFISSFDFSISLSSSIIVNWLISFTNFWREKKFFNPLSLSLVNSLEYFKSFDNEVLLLKFFCKKVLLLNLLILFVILIDILLWLESVIKLLIFSSFVFRIKL